MFDNDIDDQNEIDYFEFCESTSQNNNDCTVPAELQLEVHSDSQQLQQHDQDIAVVSAEQQLEVHCDRQQQHDNDVAVVPAEQQLEVQCDRQQLQQHDMDCSTCRAAAQVVTCRAAAARDT